MVDVLSALSRLRLSSDMSCDTRRHDSLFRLRPSWSSFTVASAGRYSVPQLVGIMRACSLGKAGCKIGLRFKCDVRLSQIAAEDFLVDLSTVVLELKVVLQSKLNRQENGK